MDTRTLANGTTITLKEDETGDNLLVILDNPNAPDDMRHHVAGRVTYGGFQPALLSAFAFRPDTLRAIADLIDEVYL